MNRFEMLHPWVQLVYYICAVFPAMLLMNPVILLISIIGSRLLLATLSGKKAFSGSVYLVVFLLCAAVNPLFSHKGETVLLFVNNNPVTLEACAYGVASALMLVGILLWFSSFSVVFTSERIVFLFGRISPKLALVFSAALNLVPRFTSRFSAVRMSVIGSQNESKKPADRLKSVVRIFSITVTRALEDAVETSDSMSARGYGVKKRTFYSEFKLSVRDYSFLLICSVSMLLFILCACLGAGDYSFYPSLMSPPVTPVALCMYCAYGIICVLPSAVCLSESIKWKLSLSKT